MIAFYAQGGLGNQLFQYAAARQVSVRLHEELVLDPHWFDHPIAGETLRPLELDKYAVQLRIASASEQRGWKWLRGRLGRYLPFLSPIRMIRERGTSYNASIEQAVPNSYLFGFWQSEKYFAGIRSLLLRELTPLQAPSALDESLLQAMDGTNAVCVHVRRGDYVSSTSASAFHGVCSLDYYERAIKYIGDRVTNPQLFIFSDDPEWTKANLGTGGLPAHYVNHNAADDAYQDLRLMSRCKHHIIANSSFSWWGAWLCTHPNQIVVAPELWFQADRPTPDLIPAKWVRL